MTDEVMTDKEAMMVLETMRMMTLDSMRLMRLSGDVIANLISKAGDAKTTLATLEKQKKELETDIANLKVNHKAEVDKFEQAKAQQRVAAPAAPVAKDRLVEPSQTFEHGPAGKDKSSK